MIDCYSLAIVYYKRFGQQRKEIYIAKYSVLRIKTLIRYMEYIMSYNTELNYRRRRQEIAIIKTQNKTIGWAV